MVFQNGVKSMQAATCNGEHRSFIENKEVCQKKKDLSFVQKHADQHLKSLFFWANQQKEQFIMRYVLNLIFVKSKKSPRLFE